MTAAIPFDAIMAWHFVGPRLRDGRPVPADGEVLTHEGPVVPCESGLHASERIIDALLYAPGDTICRIAVWGNIQHHNGDKLAGRNRVVLWRVDGEALLREFARRQALSVAHLWNMPDVVRRYLETGDESIRAVAQAVAQDAARTAAWGASGAVWAAWGAAQDAAHVATRDAALDAALAAASASWADARGSALAAANDMLTEMVEAAR